MDRILQFVSDYATGLSYERLPPEVVHQVKRRTIDAMGCALGGYHEGASKIARDYVRTVRATPGATLLGTKHRSAPELAAFANGVMVRYLDYNDTGLAGDSGHPSDNIPAVLAAAEWAGADVRTFITGVVLAYEVQGRFGGPGRLRARGWDPVTYLALSSAAGAGKVMGLTREQMANALAIAITSNVGLRQIRAGALSMWKGAAAGNADCAGVFSAILGKAGMTGPEQAFEGKFGLFNQVTGPMELVAFGGEGRPFKVEDAKFKVYPTDYEAQVAVHPALELREMLGGKVDEIESIIVDTYNLAVSIAADSPEKWSPETRETADHSIPYIVASAFVRGNIWLNDFEEKRIKDPKVRALMQKIQVREKEEYTKANPESNYFNIEVVTRAGEHLSREIRYGKGHPENPMSDQEIEAKFRRLSEPVMGRAQQDSVLDRMWHLEDVSDLREMMDIFALRSKSAKRVMSKPPNVTAG